MRRYDTDWPTLLCGVLLAGFFGLFLLYPLGFMVRSALGGSGQWSLAAFGGLLTNPLVRESVGNSLWIAVLTTLLASAVALPLAHVLTRLDFAGKGLFQVLLLVPMILPPFVGAIGLRQLLARHGSLNLLLMKLGVVSPGAPVDWLGGGGMAGIVLLQVLTLYPILWLSLSAAMANVDPALREAAQNLGASGWRLFRTVTLPLILPGYFAGAVLVFIWSFTDLGSPLVFGYSRVVPVQIFDAVNDLNTNPVGYALVLVVLGLTLGLFLAAKRCFGGRRYEMMSRGHVGSGPVRANARQTAWVWLGLGALLGLSLLPHLMVLVQSLGRGWFMRVLPAEWTLANYGAVFGHGLTLSSIRNSLFYSALSAGLDLVLGVAIAWLLTRRRVPLAGWLDALAMLPLALPGLVLAFGYVGGFDLPSVLPTGLRETVADWRTASAGGLGEAFWSFGWLNPRTNPTLLLVVSYSVRRLPYIVRSAYAGFQQTSVTLEEASASLGASPWHTLRRITLPLIAANLVAGTILTFAFAMLEVSDSLILAMRQQYFPITKMLWGLLGRLEPDAPGVACALGVLGMLILGACLFAASRFMGRRLGQLFRV